MRFFYMFIFLIQEIIIFSNALNSYFHNQEPWKIKEESHFKSVIYTVLKVLIRIGGFLSPIMPTTMNELLAKIGIEQKTLCWQDLKENPLFSLGEDDSYLFKKIEQEKTIASNDEQ